VLVLLREGFMKYTIEMVSGGMIYIPSLMKIDSDIKVILKVLPKKFEML
jgi:hypothetical protein